MSNKQMNISHIYAGNPLDRGDRERRDEEWLANRAKDPGSKFLPLWDLKVLISNRSDPGLAWLDVDGLRQLEIEASAIFLGLRDHEAYFAIDISKSGNAVRELQETEAWRFEDARTVTEYLSGPGSGIVAQARAQISWHSRNGFCSICGHETFVRRGGHVRQCSKRVLPASQRRRQWSTEGPWVETGLSFSLHIDANCRSLFFVGLT